VGTIENTSPPSFLHSKIQGAFQVQSAITLRQLHAPQHGTISTPTLLKCAHVPTVASILQHLFTRGKASCGHGDLGVMEPRSLQETMRLDCQVSMGFGTNTLLMYLKTPDSPLISCSPEKQLFETVLHIHMFQQFPSNP
jgi:hypothetical protein